MRSFHQDNRQSSFGPRDFKKKKESFRTVCGNCHAPCEVPFKPRGSKPVLCNNCFKPSRDGGPSSSSRFDYNDRPRDSRPSSDRFSRSHSQPQDSGSANSKQMDAINKKLDLILSILNDLTEEDEEGTYDEE